MVLEELQILALQVVFEVHKAVCVDKGWTGHWISKLEIEPKYVEAQHSKLLVFGQTSSSQTLYCGAINGELLFMKKPEENWRTADMQGELHLDRKHSLRAKFDPAHGLVLKISKDTGTAISYEYSPMAEITL